MTRTIVALLVAATLAGAALASAGPPAGGEAVRLSPAAATGIRLDTLLLGGFASGTFQDALDHLASDLSDEERILVGRHLERIFADALPARHLGSIGRLRLAYERALRPDGTPRSIRVLSAEVAVGGRVHTAYYFEREDGPAYFDAIGRSLDAGGWAGPLANLRVSSPFGSNRLHPILGRVLPHTGVDLVARAGEPVHATADGFVALAGDQGGYGLLVELRHPNGYSTRYAHLSRLAPGIEPARVVRQGEVLGYVGMTGLATGPHLHYEVRRRGQPVDPLAAAARDRIAGEVAADPRWISERQHLGSLLSRAPTTQRAPARATGRI